MGKCWQLRRSGFEYYFEDEQGNQSERYFWAGNYFDGFAIVQKEDFEPYYYRDIRGNLSEEFFYVEHYNDGVATVRKDRKSPTQYRDICGNLHNSLEQAKNASKNANETRNRNKKESKSISVKKDACANIEDYFSNKVTVYDLSPKDIYDNLDKIVAWEKYNCELEMGNNDDKAIREEIFKTYSDVADYIKQTAYEYSDKLKVEEYIEKLF